VPQVRLEWVERGPRKGGCQRHHSHEEKEEVMKLAQFVMQGSQAKRIVTCNRMAWITQQGAAIITALSVAGSSTSVKSVRAALSTGNVAFYLYGSDAIGQYIMLSRYKGGYKFGWHRLGPDFYHLVAVAKLPGFMPRFSEEALFQELKSPRFTTPIIREWVPALSEELRYRGHLEVVEQHGLTTGMLHATTEDLDAALAAIAPLPIPA
jgi:hypothetical protein